MTTRSRRTVALAVGAFAAAFVLGLVAVANAGFTKDKLWECNRCHQQYMGDHPPPFVKCPATDNKQPHWWIQKH